jgi:hypothetical protein
MENSVLVEKAGVALRRTADDLPSQGRVTEGLRRFFVEPFESDWEKKTGLTCEEWTKKRGWWW